VFVEELAKQELTEVKVEALEATEVGGSSYEETSNSVAFDAGLEAGLGGFFSATLKSEFQNRGVNKETRFFKQQQQVYTQTSFELRNPAPALLKKFLDEDFREHLNSAGVIPEKLFATYGYVFPTSLSFGGKYNTTIHTASSKIEQYNDFGLEVGAKGGFGPASFGANVKMKWSDEHKLGGEDFSLQRDAYGGDTDLLKNITDDDDERTRMDKVTKWSQTIQTMPMAITKFTLMELWKLCDDDQRAAELKEYAMKRSQELKS
jgi:hypothetical protein